MGEDGRGNSRPCQTKFHQMCSMALDSLVGRGSRVGCGLVKGGWSCREPENRPYSKIFVYLNLFALDDMGGRIDDLEKNIADLMTQAGVEEGRP